MVAGTLALLLPLNPEATIDQLRTALLSSSDPLDSVDAGKLANGGGKLNALQAITDLRTQTLNGGYGRTVLGDEDGFQRNDVFILRRQLDVNGMPTGQTEILRRNSAGAYVVLTTISNTSGNRIAVFMLKGNDSLTIATGVNNPIFVHGGTGNNVVVGNDANDTIVSASGDSFMLAGNDDFILTGSSTPETKGLFSRGRIVDILFDAEDNVDVEPLLF